MKHTHTINIFRLVALFAAVAVLAGCSDDRKAPLQTNDPVYEETIILFDRTPAAGADLTATFTIEDTLTNGRLILNNFLRPDAALSQYITIGAELDSIAQRLLNLEGQILNIDLKPTKTHEDSVAMDSLRVLKTATEGEQSTRVDRQDSLDTRLDDRFKVSIWLDNDVVEMYPRAIFLDSAAVPGQLAGGETMVWGQNCFTAPALDTTGLRGRRMTLNLNQIMIADATYRHRTKPSRPANPDQLPELYPINDWLTRLNPGTHRLHIRFGAPGTDTQTSASLYVIYKNPR